MDPSGSLWLKLKTKVKCQEVDWNLGEPLTVREQGGADLGCFPGGVVYTFIFDRSVPYVILLGLVCCSLSMTLITVQ